VNFSSYGGDAAGSEKIAEAGRADAFDVGVEVAMDAAIASHAGIVAAGKSVK
jgi:hypothetical protein